MKTNEELRQDVMNEIQWDPELRIVAPEIGVAAKDGVVTLTGKVNTYRKRIAAEKAAQRVSGVKVVASDIQVGVSTESAKTDTEIAEAVKDALRWNSAVDEDQIEVKVDNGWIYLDGTVEWEYERGSAQRSVENLIGVKGVTNMIAIKSKTINKKELKSQIAAAFHRSATIDSTAVAIDCEGSKVTLHGKVRSWAEKRDAEKIAWAYPGVTDVDNQIEIDVAVYA